MSMAERAARPDLRYRVVCYELSGYREQLVMDATGAGFIAATGVLSAGRLKGELMSAGPRELQLHLALRIASDDQLADR
jgi:hypothetical protein